MRVNYYLKLSKEQGLVKIIQILVQKAIGVYRQKEEIDTLYYFLNQYIDAKNIPPTSDVKLRELQICDAIFLSIFDKICNQNGLTYWLDFGTLLGAVRHRGFIPWDDDMDVAMPRQDYNRITEILKAEFTKDGFGVVETLGRTGFHYKHEKTGVWIDIFPVDTWKCKSTDELSKKKLLKLIQQ